CLFQFVFWRSSGLDFYAAYLWTSAGCDPFGQAINLVIDGIFLVCSLSYRHQAAKCPHWLAASAAWPALLEAAHRSGMEKNGRGLVCRFTACNRYDVYRCA